MIGLKHVATILKAHVIGLKTFIDDTNEAKRTEVSLAFSTIATTGEEMREQEEETGLL